MAASPFKPPLTTFVGHSGRPRQCLRVGRVRWAIACVLLPALGVFQAAPAQAQAVPPNVCGNPFVNHFGPWDYRSARKQDIEVVERFHFSPGVESMTKKMTSEFGADVDYTLGVFPNHHRALRTMMRLGEKYKTDLPPGAQYNVECYFDRALRFSPDDNIARALYAQYLARHERKPQALQQLALAVAEAKDRPLSHYSLGLVYLEMGEFELALKQAHEAKRLGMENLRQLEEELRKAGKWRDADAS